MSVASDKLIVGKIGAPFGVKGWVKINSFTQYPKDIFDYEPWFLGHDREVELELWRQQNKGLVAKFVGVDTRDQADALKHLEITVSQDSLPELDDELYWKDIIGMQVTNTQGYSLGVVKQLFETGAKDVMVVRANSNDAFAQSERLIPFVYDEIVIDVDKQSNTLIVEWDPAF